MDGMMSAERPQPPYPPAAGGASLPEMEAAWQRVWEASQTPLERGLPPDALASPAHVHAGPDPHITWWRPSWRDGWQYVGWRWVLLIPAGVLALLGLLALRWGMFAVPMLVLGGKLLVLAGAIALSLAGYVVRRATRARTEPFCIFCGYNLSGLPDNYRCPECGRPYTWRVIGEYRRDPQWFIERYRAMRALPPADRPFEAGSVRRRRADGT
jgi:hypothetical protein